MKRLLFLLILSLSVFPLTIGCQTLIDLNLQNIKYCDFPVTENGEPVSKPYQFKNQGDSKSLTLDFTINYLAAGTTLNGNTCIDWPPEAMTAFDYAASIWSDVLENTQNIGVDACWTADIGVNTLGSAGSNGIEGLTIPGLGTFFFSIALAEHLLSSQLKTVDINASFNAGRSDWYYGLDAQTPLNKVDFVSVVLHELGHGLGFFGAHKIDDGIFDEINDNFEECDGVAGHGCIGFYIGGQFDTYIPTIFDLFIDQGINGDELLSLPNPGTEIASYLTGGNGGLDFDYSNAHYFYDGCKNMKLHTPPVYIPGSSYSHFDEATLGNELMSPSLSFGQGIHDIGLAEEVMYNIGWSVSFLKNKVTTLSDTGYGSLRKNIERSCPDDVIQWQNGLQGDITLTNGEIYINHPLTIKGLGVNNSSVSGNLVDRIFHIGSSGNVTLENLMLKNANKSINGGAIYLEGGILNLNNLTFTNNFEGLTPKAMTLSPSSTLFINGNVSIIE